MSEHVRLSERTDQALVNVALDVERLRKAVVHDQAGHLSDLERRYLALELGLGARVAELERRLAELEGAAEGDGGE